MDKNLTARQINCSQAVENSQNCHSFLGKENLSPSSARLPCATAGAAHCDSFHHQPRVVVKATCNWSCILALSQRWMPLRLAAVHPALLATHLCRIQLPPPSRPKASLAVGKAMKPKGFFFNFRVPVNNTEHELCHEGDANCWLLHFLLPSARWELFYCPFGCITALLGYSALPKSAAGAQLPRGSPRLHAPGVHPPLLPRVS